MNNDPQTSVEPAKEQASSPSAFKKMVQSVKRITTRHAKSDVERAYKFGQELGTGNFAVVRLAEHRGTKQKYACKIINKALCAGKEDMIETEISVLKKVKHKYIVGMHECFDTPDKLYLVLDYVSGGELFDRIVDEGNFTEADASRITKQMTEAIQYLHEQGIVHRDLKPENLLFRDRSPNSDILVTDFGLAKLLNDNVVLKTACGTPNYVSPEILMQRGYGKQVDVWSLGVILFILLCGYPPFYDESDAVLFELIMKGRFDFDERYWKDISKEAKHLISNMLVVDPIKRYDTCQVLQHPWITGKAHIPTVNLSKSISMNLKKTGLGQGSKNDEEAFKTASAPRPQQQQQQQQQQQYQAPAQTPTAGRTAATSTSSSSSSSSASRTPQHSHRTGYAHSSTSGTPSSSSSSEARRRAARQKAEKVATNLSKVPETRKTVV
ncbi:CAMK/CAMK1 protein kinase [Salpingoeca rosetta]|uniref:CAMK/CAMK1 protein kinase n=1 Tax=Salpingoeca rosetta (strain ATCC 50818 / BSB-021) TaxID=946362 RepID=F2TVP7_SALR5|nr:CAMK/CAMK1 protein kinase [Salpingoeca rosetta]EGD72143.1 CAMK/CAMK1 protein kinase [Salpingoeca rosetta]|eukprot:XP_004998715.1 CAMK/CAMK1 protein kinase [Salpingoeca rosetta]